MAYQNYNVSATFVPGGFDEYYEPPPPPTLISPLPQRHMPEMSDQIQEGLAHMDLSQINARASIMSSMSCYAPSPFPKLVNPSPNVPPTDDEFEITLDNARSAVLSSNDPEMQLAWAQDVLQQVGINADDRDRLEIVQPPRPRTPPAENQLKMDAMNIVSFLADQHHPKAEFLRGMWFEFGRFGCLVDKKEAFRCYSRAADKGYARAEYRVGMLYEASNDPAKALKHYHKGADLEDSACLYRLGMMTLRGQHGQEQDYFRGVDLIRRSAQLADENAAQGAYVYGMLLARQLPQISLPDGILPFDERAARVEIEKAAYMKFAKAQLKMGYAYELASLGCEFNPSYSMHYYALAAKQGEAEADMGISKWFLVGHEGLFSKSEELAYNYAQRAALSGFANAEFALGYFNELGIHVPRNLDVAIDWYTKAARNGNGDAQARIESIARKQVLSRTDHENIAIGRIKSQYGSKKGNRPVGLTQHNRVPSIGDGQQSQRRPSGTPIPPRSGSTTPYPVSDGPPILPPIDRPATTMSYPVEGPPRRGTPSSAFMNMPPAGQRPDGAFSTPPDHLRPNTAASMQNPKLRYPSGPGPVPRPSTTVDQYGRPPPNMRHVSSPAGSPYNRPMDQAQSPLGPSRTPIQSPSHAPQQSLDIGYVAPLENRRVRPVQRPNMDKPLPPPQHPGTPGPLSPPPSGLSTPAPGNQPYGMRKSSRPDMRSASSHVSTASSMPAKSAPSTPAPTTAPQKPAMTPAAKPPPGKGPKTFEEMGVPATKQEQECIVM